MLNIKSLIEYKYLTLGKHTIMAKPKLRFMDGETNKNKTKQNSVEKEANLAFDQMCLF